MANKSRPCNEGKNFMAYLCVRSVFGARAQKAYHLNLNLKWVSCWCVFGGGPGGHSLAPSAACKLLKWGLWPIGCGPGLWEAKAGFGVFIVTQRARKKG